MKITKSYARIHKANLCNFGILPLTFKNPGDYDLVSTDSTLELSDIKRHLEHGDTEIPVKIGSQMILTLLDVSNRQRQSLVAGGMLNLVRQELGN